MLNSFGKTNFRYKIFILLIWVFQLISLNSGYELNQTFTYIWPLPHEFSYGNETLSVNPAISSSITGKGGNFKILREGFRRYKRIIFRYSPRVSDIENSRRVRFIYDVSKLRFIVNSDSEELNLGVDETYTLLIAKNASKSIIWEIIIEANTVYGALRGLETFSQLCVFDYTTKLVHVSKAPWYIKDKPRFSYRGLLLDTSRHYLPVDTIKSVIDSMSYAKLNVLHWHIVDRQSFPLEVPSYPKLWDAAYSKLERYTVEDASGIVRFAKTRGVHVMAELDLPGHANSWGVGYPDLWPNTSCKEPLDVTKNFTFDVISGILSDFRKIFPFELFHLGGDEVNTDCWNNTPHVQKWLNNNKMKPKDAYQYFVLKAQKIAISKNWSPVNWEETFNAFASKLTPRTVVHNWLGPGVCPKVVARGLRCIFSNQAVWYLDHLDTRWEEVYNAEPLEGIHKVSEQNRVLGGEVCMWGELVDMSNVQLLIWPRAAAAAERLWSSKEALVAGNVTAGHRLHYFRCLLNRRGIQAGPVAVYVAPGAPSGPGSCYRT